MTQIIITILGRPYEDIYKYFRFLYSIIVNNEIVSLAGFQTEKRSLTVDIKLSELIFSLV